MSNSLVPFKTRLANLFEDFERDFGRSLGSAANGGTEMTMWLPHVNLAETDNEYSVTIDLPGMSRDDIHVEFNHGDLWITGERKNETKDCDKNWHRIESSYGSFRRMVRLGEAIDTENVDAEYKDGVLKITVPKTETAKPHRIEIRC